MNAIQIALILLSFSAAIFSRLIFRSKLGYRLMIIGLLLTATLFIVIPRLSTTLAHVLGVGRGADLLFYIFFFTGIHILLLLYLRIRKLELKLTESIRALAVGDAERVLEHGRVAAFQEQSC